MTDTTLTLEQALQQAVKYHRAGQLPEAEQLYRAILQAQPTHADANHNLGVLAVAVNKIAEALPFFKLALETNPNQAQFWLSYIDALIKTQQFELARSVLTQGQNLGLQGDNVTELAQWLNAPSQAELLTLQTFLSQQNYAAAEPLARQLSQRFPQHPLIWQALGEILQNLGQLDAAVAAKQQAVALSPDDVNALYNLGNGLRELKRFAEAEHCYRQALAVNPDDESCLNNLGMTLAEQQRFAEAELIYRQLIESKANNANAHYNLANTLKELGQLTAAKQHYQQTLALNPHHAEAYNGLGNTYKRLGDFDNAEKACSQAIVLNPHHADAHNNLGNIFKELGRLTEAEQSFRQSIAINAQQIEAHNNLANLFNELGDFTAAEQHYLHAIAIDPTHADAYSNLGNIFNAQGRVEEAEHYYLQAIALNPRHADAHNNLANPLRDCGRLNEAETHYRHAIAINPDHAIAYANLGNVLQELGRFDEAEFCYRQALRINPAYAESCGNLLFSLNYSDKYSLAYRLAEAKRYGELVAQKVTQKFTAWQCDLTPQRLRVGIVSGDLCSHPVSYFLESLLAHIDKASIELIAFPTYRKVDEVTERLSGYFVDWKPLVDLRDAAAAQLIHNEGIHILLDLSGYTGHNRLPVFAWKPAPIQVNWLGYWATTGVAEMDAILVDKVGVPEQNQWHFSEKVHYLPDTRLCFSAPDFAIHVSDLPVLSNGYITFGCFQNLSKVTDAVLTAWQKILQQLPTARLRFQGKQFRDATFTEQFIARLEGFGITAQRISTHSISSREDYLRAYHEVDFVLDTFPFTGGTTTCEALWMGVPTLTLAGETLLARQGASLLSAAGLLDWIVASESEYVKQAVVFANNVGYLAQLRSHLREQVLATPLFDGKRFARNFEDTLWQLWLDYQSVKLTLGCGKNEIC